MCLGNLRCLASVAQGLHCLGANRHHLHCSAAMHPLSRRWLPRDGRRLRGGCFDVRVHYDNDAVHHQCCFWVASEYLDLERLVLRMLRELPSPQASAAVASSQEVEVNPCAP